MRHVFHPRGARRSELPTVTDPETGRTYPVPAGGDDDSDADVDDDDDDDDDDDEDDDLDEDELGESGKKALSNERKARRDAQKAARAEKRRADAAEARAARAEDRLQKIAAGEAEVDVDDVRQQLRGEIEDEVRRELAEERATIAAERAALAAGVKPKRVAKFVKLLDLDDALNDDGTVDREALKELIDDELEALPEFKAAGGGSDDDGYHGADQGARRGGDVPFDKRVEAEAQRLADRFGVKLPG